MRRLREKDYTQVLSAASDSAKDANLLIEQAREDDAHSIIEGVVM